MGMYGMSSKPMDAGPPNAKPLTVSVHLGDAAMAITMNFMPYLYSGVPRPEPVSESRTAVRSGTEASTQVLPVATGVASTNAFSFLNGILIFAFDPSDKARQFRQRRMCDQS